MSACSSMLTANLIMGHFYAFAAASAHCEGQACTFPASGGNTLLQRASTNEKSDVVSKKNDECLDYCFACMRSCEGNGFDCACTEEYDTFNQSDDAGHFDCDVACTGEKHSPDPEPDHVCLNDCWNCVDYCEDATCECTAKFNAYEQLPESDHFNCDVACNGEVHIERSVEDEAGDILEQLDQNKDGSLSMNETCVAFETPSECTDVFNNADADGDELVGLQELVAYMTKTREESEIAHIIREHDDNEDGFLSKDEACRGDQKNSEHCADQFQAVDTDNDGKISLEELTAYIKSSHTNSDDSSSMSLVKRRKCRRSKSEFRPCARWI